jgi:DNA polymerase-1
MSPADWTLSKRIPAMSSKEDMIQRVLEEIAIDGGIRPGVRRAKTYKALNAVIQGSAADQIKKAMVDCDKAGIWDALPLHLTVHDELDVSVPRTKEGQEAFREMVGLMEKAIPLKVPVKADWKIGSNWGEC